MGEMLLDIILDDVFLVPNRNVVLIELIIHGYAGVAGDIIAIYHQSLLILIGNIYCNVISNATLAYR